MATRKKPITQAKIDQQFAKTKEVAKSQDQKRICLPVLDNLNDNILEVGYNGRMYLIKRGEKVSVPGAICEILDNANVPYQKIAH